MSRFALSDYGFMQPRSALAGSEDEAAILASDIGYPLVLKIESPDILHKTDLSGVELGLDSEEAVRTAYRRIRSAVEEHAPQARVEGVRVEEMLSGGFEIIIGLKRDAQFGPVIMFGLGGIFTELLDDVSFRVLPISPGDAGQMVAETRGAAACTGIVGKPLSHPSYW